MKLIGTILFVFLVFGITACGGGSGGERDNSFPNNPKEALNKLSPSHRAQYDSWKDRVIKSCVAGEIFNSDNDSHRDLGVDYKALYKTNGNTLVVSNNSSFALIGGYTSFSGVGESKFDETLNVNGKGYRIQASTKRNGSSCEVYLYGQKVYETKIAQTASVKGYWVSDKEVTPTRFNAEIKNYPSQNVAVVTGHRVSDSLWQSLSPNKDAYDLLSRKLSVAHDDIMKYFKIREAASYDFNTSFKLEDQASRYWFSYSDEPIVGNIEKLKNIFSVTGQTEKVLVRVKTPDFFLYGDQPSTWSFVADLNSALVEDKKVLYFDGFKYLGVEAGSNRMASDCLIQRAEILNSIASNQTKLEPNLSDIEKTCGVHTHVIEKDLEATNTYTYLLPRILSAANPSYNYDYNGWGSRIVDLVIKYSDVGKSSKQLLDPYQEAPVIGMVIDNVTLSEKLVKQFSNLAQVRELVLNTSAYWGLHGDNASSSDINYILSALSNSIDPFYQSTVSLIYSLDKSSKIRTGELQFAKDISSDLKQKATKAKGLAQSLKYKKWMSDEFDRAIQKQHSELFFENWISKLSTVKNGLFRYQNLNSYYGKLTELSLKWLSNGEVQASKLDGIYSSLSNIADAFPQQTKDLIKRLEQSLPNTKEDLEFAASLSNEYKNALVSVRNLSKKIGFEVWGERIIKNIFKEKYPLSQVQIWNQTLVAGKDFVEREKQRTQGTSNSPWNDRYKNEILETALAEGWSNTQFTDLEKISLLGKYKTLCDHYSGFSTIANCLGMDNFQMKTGKYFAPQFGNRYGQLAGDFVRYMKLLSGNDYWSMKNDLLRGYFGSSDNYIWKRCNSTNFSSRSNELKNLITRYKNINDTFEKWELERNINDTMKDCN